MAENERIWVNLRLCDVENENSEELKRGESLFLKRTENGIEMHGQKEEESDDKEVKRTENK